MTKHIAVWGSTGAQGSAVVQEALSQGLRVRAIARSKQRITDKFQEQVEACEADLINLESATKALRGVDAAFAHLPMTADSTQPPIFLQNLIAAARKANLPLLVFTTSGPTGERYDPVPMIAGTTAARDAILNSGIASIVLQPTVYLEQISSQAGSDNPFALKPLRHKHLVSGWQRSCKARNWGKPWPDSTRRSASCQMMHLISIRKACNRYLELR